MSGAADAEIHTEYPWSPCWDNFALRPALKDKGLVAWSGRVRKRAYCKGSLVLIGSEKVVEALMAQGLEEVFSGQSIRQTLPCRNRSCQILPGSTAGQA